ncbi:MAG: ATPase domain-containing protein [Candidatus Bathyarchaeia archaeon]
MRSKTAALLLIIALAMLQSGLHAASGDPLTTQVTLYAHTDPSATSVGGRVLTLVSNSTARQSADVRDGLAFALVPPLSAPLHIHGDISVYVWLSSQSSVQGTLRIAISEVTANASAIEITSASVTLGIPSVPYPPQPYPSPTVIFGQAGIDHTLATGSTLRLEVQFSPVRPVPVSLLWDDPSTRTRLVLEAEPSPHTSLTITDSSGRVSAIFAQNETGLTKLIAKVSIEEPFGGINVQTVSLRATNSSGHVLINDTRMTLTSRGEPPLRLIYTLPITVPAGRFNVTATVRDLTQRTFVTTTKFTVAHFYTLVLLLVDTNERPLPGLNASLSAAGQLIGESTTDSTGTAVLAFPPSGIVGPITVDVWKNRMKLLSRNFDLEQSNSVLKLVVEMYGWTFLVTVEYVGLPISGARVELSQNETLVASNSTDRNGLAVFTPMLNGTYEVTVVAPFGSTQFHNVTHAPEVERTMLYFPFLIWILTWIRNNAILLAAAIAIIVLIGAVAVTRRRARTRHFKHVADLLGGTLPGSVIIMIVGPSGSGKSLLLQNILSDSLRLRRRCVYVTNSEMPSRIKKQLARMGLDTERYQKDNMLRFIDAYSGGSGVVSSEQHSVSSPRDLTALGIQVTSCLDEVGGVGDVFLDSLAPIAAPNGSTRAMNFVEYYGARIVKAGGSFLYVASDTIEPDLLRRFEDSSDCVLQTERYAGPGKVRNQLLVKKARGMEHEHGWVGLKIAPNGRVEFVSLPAKRV